MRAKDNRHRVELAGKRTMSLKFGLWLVEQGIMTCDQFCGLVRIQQDALPSPAAVVLRENVMTLRQVSATNLELERTGSDDFVAAAEALGFLPPKLAIAIRQLQQMEAPSIRTLAIQCGLVSADQAVVLERHFGKLRMQKSAATTAQPAPTDEPESNEVAAGSASDSTPGNYEPHPVPEPKFRQRPVIVHQYDVTY